MFSPCCLERCRVWIVRKIERLSDNPISSILFHINFVSRLGLGSKNRKILFKEIVSVLMLISSRRGWEEKCR